MTQTTNLPNDLSSYWMPFTANRAFKNAPRLVVSADRMHYKSSDGRDILDGTAGLWCVNAGHNAPRITEAVQKQVAKLDYAPCFQFGHPAAFEFATRIADLFPDGMDHADRVKTLLFRRLLKVRCTTARILLNPMSVCLSWRPGGHVALLIPISSKHKIKRPVFRL